MPISLTDHENRITELENFQENAKGFIDDNAINIEKLQEQLLSLTKEFNELKDKTANHW